MFCYTAHYIQLKNTGEEGSHYCLETQAKSSGRGRIEQDLEEEDQIQKVKFVGEGKEGQETTWTRGLMVWFCDKTDLANV